MADTVAWLVENDVLKKRNAELKAEIERLRAELAAKPAGTVRVRAAVAANGGRAICRISLTPKCEPLNATVRMRRLLKCVNGL